MDEKTKVSVFIWKTWQPTGQSSSNVSIPFLPFFCLCYTDRKRLYDKCHCSRACNQLLFDGTVTSSQSFFSLFFPFQSSVSPLIYAAVNDLTDPTRSLVKLSKRKQLIRFVALCVLKIFRFHIVK